MLLFLLALPSSPAVSALTLPFPASIAFANLSSPLSFNHSNEPRAKENPSALFFSSSKDSEQWSRTISPTLDFANIPFSPFSEWNNTFISAFNVSVGPHPIPPPSPRECRYRCNGARLGTNLNPSSCLQAWTLIPPLERTLSFGPRGKPTIYDVGLPRRYLSCMFFRYKFLLP